MKVGDRIEVIQDGFVYTGTIQDITDDGALYVLDDNTTDINRFFYIQPEKCRVI